VTDELGKLIKCVKNLSFPQKRKSKGAFLNLPLSVIFQLPRCHLPLCSISGAILLKFMG